MGRFKDIVTVPLRYGFDDLVDRLDIPGLAGDAQIQVQSTGKKIRETLAVFDVAPLAAASISQVHRGVLKADGRIASIKVQRSGIRAKMETDLDLLEALAVQLHERVEGLRVFEHGV